MEDSWRRIDPPAEIGTGDLLLPWRYWREHRDELARHEGRVGIYLDSADEVEELYGQVGQFPLIALDFPTFKDGRGYSQARLLRERLGFRGELRAIGDVLRDQLFFMKRCGIDSYQVREDKDIEDALQGLADFSVTYQSAADGALPAYKNR